MSVQINHQSRAGLTLALVLALLLGCRPAPAPAQATLAPADYWARTEPIALEATLHLRLVNHAARAFAENRLAFDPFRQTLGRLAPEIFGLGQRLVAVDPPASLTTVHRSLVEALDLLVLSGREGRAVAQDADPRHIAAIAVLLPEAQRRLAAYSSAMPPSAGAEAVRQRIAQLGDTRLKVIAERMFTVYLGPFDSPEAARQALGQLAFDSDGDLAIPQTRPYIVPAGSYATRSEAEQAASTIRMARVSARVEQDFTYDFRAEVRTPPTGYYWREQLWQQTLAFPAAMVAVSAAGDFVLAASRDGAVQGWQGTGQYLWHRDLDAAIMAMALAAGGERAVLAGYGSFLLTRNRDLIWKSPFRTNGQPLVQAAIADDGQHVTLRTGPPDGTGRVHALNTSSYLWPTLPYIGARDMALRPDGSQVAIVSAKQGRKQFILVSIPAGQRLRRFDLPVLPERVALTADGSHAAILGNREVLLYRLADERLLWRQPAIGNLLAFTLDGQAVVTGGQAGLAATALSGQRLWTYQNLQVYELTVNQHYVVVRSDRDRLDVFRTDGARLGPVYTPGSLLAFALARDSNLLVATDNQRHMAAWQLP